MENLFLHGITQFNSHDFFECHDVWEELWMDTSGADKLFYQGLIQIAVGYYHASHGNYSGARNLFMKALLKLSAYLPAHHNVDLSALLPVFESHLRGFQNTPNEPGNPFDLNNAPAIVLMAQGVS